MVEGEVEEEAGEEEEGERREGETSARGRREVLSVLSAVPEGLIRMVVRLVKEEREGADKRGRAGVKAMG